MIYFIVNLCLIFLLCSIEFVNASADSFDGVENDKVKTTPRTSDESDGSEVRFVDVPSFLKRPQVVVSGKQYDVFVDKELKSKLEEKEEGIENQFIAVVEDLQKSKDIFKGIEYFRFGLCDSEVFWEGCLGGNAL